METSKARVAAGAVGGLLHAAIVLLFLGWDHLWLSLLVGAAVGTVGAFLPPKFLVRIGLLERDR